jgi:hypothetical protein
MSEALVLDIEGLELSGAPVSKKVALQLNPTANYAYILQSHGTLRYTHTHFFFRRRP